MPKCVVKACPHATGQKTAYPDISLHAFPRKIPQMQAWLRLAGMSEEMVKDFTEMIIEDKRSDKFRMCSAHFTEDCYTKKGVRRALKEDSLPTIFPREVPIFDETLDPWVRRNNRRARTEDPSADPDIEPYARPRRCFCDCHRQGHLVDTATQTDAVFILAMVQQVPYTKLASHKSITMDHEYTKSTEPGLAGPVKPVTTTQRTFVSETELRPAEDSHPEIKSRQNEKIRVDLPDCTAMKNVGTPPTSGLNKEDEYSSSVQIKEEPLSDEDSSTSCPPYPPASIKEEPCEEELVPLEMDYTTVVVNDCPTSSEDITCPPEVSMTTHQMKEEMLSVDENLPCSDVPTTTRHVWSTSNVKKKRPSSEERSMVSDSPTHALQPQNTSKKQAVINDARPRTNVLEGLPHFEGSRLSSTNRESMEITVTVNNCSKCEESFTSHEELLQHKQIHHPERLAGFYSELLKEVKPKVAVMADAKALQKNPPFMCQYCGKVCKSLNFLTRHEEVHQSKTYNCLECGRCFTSSIGLTVHQKTHKVEKVVDYPKCRQAFLIDSSLILQQPVCAAQMSIICFECGKVFEVKQSLKEHESSHEDKTIYRCSECQSRTHSSSAARKPQLLRTVPSILPQRNGF